MDTETVVAVGFVIHELLGLVGGLILCYFGYRLLMRRVRAQPREIRGTWNLAKRFIKNAAPGTLFALFGAVAIWLTASNALTPKTFAPKNSVDFALLPSKEGRTTTPAPAEKEGAIAMTLGAAAPGARLILAILQKITRILTHRRRLLQLRCPLPQAECKRIGMRSRPIVDFLRRKQGRPTVGPLKVNDRKLDAKPSRKNDGRLSAKDLAWKKCIRAI